LLQLLAGRAEDARGGAAADLPLPRQSLRGQRLPGLQPGYGAVKPLVARVGVRLGRGTGCTREVTAVRTGAAVGGGPDGRPLPQRDRTAPASLGVGVGLGEVAQAAVGVDDVAAGVPQHPRGLGGVDQVVRVAVSVDPGQRRDLARPVGPEPRRPLVLEPVVGAADAACFLRVPSPEAVPVPAAHCRVRHAASGHVSAADHRTPVDRRNRSYLLGQSRGGG
jgi:hypothetical protein